MKRPLETLPTPSLVLHQQRFDNNVARLYSKCSGLNTYIRPHLKTAKSIALAKRMQQPPMRGITVSTLQEAEYFFDGGFTDILYAVTLAPNKIDRAIELVTRCPTMLFLIDNLSVLDRLERSLEKVDVVINLMIEIDVDGHRAGLLPDEDDLRILAQRISTNKSLAFCGLMTHAGESYACQTQAELARHAALEVEKMRTAKQYLRGAGIECPWLSIGSTPAANVYEDLNGIDEVRAGVFVFYDLVMANIGVCEIADIALGVLATVISHKKSHNRVIIDAGGLALSKDRGTASQAKDYGYGLVVDPITWRPIYGLIVHQANQEHGVICLRNDEQFSLLSVGTKVIVLPNHACMTAAAYSEYHVFENGSIIERYDRVNGW
ncbi:MAG: alanine racemase [Pseudomonadota bacterium]